MMIEMPSIVTKGYARILVTTPNGGEVTLRHYTVGDIVLPTELDKLQAVYQVVVEPTSAQVALERLNTQRKRDDEISIQNSIMPVQAKIIPHLEWLYQNTPRAMATPSGDRAVQITQGELAQDLHSERQTINRVLRVLEAEGMIERQYGFITLHDKVAALA